jgi:hypothetical protein
MAFGIKQQICEKFNKPCACIDCRPLNFCVEDPCYGCDGPTAERCAPPEDTDSQE